mmetsp:Transcript_37061/g.92978  ORF Transcript_37061/g.92978 Transcript_37061/m.92978 type:complete len:823 (-) Transcript_37061:60-2528(-)|eukprot:CAMPEP_0177647642 /NCGR_PEP_ID=MMETSP0447-20121125/10408_1 /TAXON_ID=0 /ORGANISM="Stygamoeba regulata, Strain BSH-02190019" /LENGTH=822 /DNA_ID=CAMNT_0019150239 /DNA_START=389 /DNA_END=2857 /DNA_ORIENTATION=-
MTAIPPPWVGAKGFIEFAADSDSDAEELFELAQRESLVTSRKAARGFLEYVIEGKKVELLSGGGPGQDGLAPEEERAAGWIHPLEEWKESEFSPFEKGKAAEKQRALTGASNNSVGGGNTGGHHRSRVLEKLSHLKRVDKLRPRRLSPPARHFRPFVTHSFEATPSQHGRQQPSGEQQQQPQQSAGQHTQTATAQQQQQHHPHHILYHRRSSHSATTASSGSSVTTASRSESPLSFSSERSSRGRSSLGHLGDNAQSASHLSDVDHPSQRRQHSNLPVNHRRTTRRRRRRRRCGMPMPAAAISSDESSSERREHLLPGLEESSNKSERLQLSSENTKSKLSGVEKEKEKELMLLADSMGDFLVHQLKCAPVVLTDAESQKRAVDRAKRRNYQLVNKQFLRLCRRGCHEDIQDFIAQHSVVDMHYENTHGENAVFSLASCGTVGTMRLLVSRGAHISNSVTHSRQTPLHMAAAAGNIPMIMYLLECAPTSVNAQAYDGSAPLHIAVRNNKLHAAELLLANNAAINVQDYAGWTPLHAAVDHDHLDMITLLLRLNAKLNIRTHSNDTALHLAAQRGAPRIIETLLQYGAKNNCHLCSQGKPCTFVTEDVAIFLQRATLKHARLASEERQQRQPRSKLLRLPISLPMLSLRHKQQSKVASRSGGGGGGGIKHARHKHELDSSEGSSTSDISMEFDPPLRASTTTRSISLSSVSASSSTVALSPSPSAQNNSSPSPHSSPPLRAVKKHQSSKNLRKPFPNEKPEHPRRTTSDSRVRDPIVVHVDSDPSLVGDDDDSGRGSVRSSTSGRNGAKRCKRRFSLFRRTPL